MSTAQPGSLDLLDTTAMPLHDPVATLALAAERSSVTSAWVAGHVRTWDRRLVGADVAALRDEVAASRGRIEGRLEVAS